MDFPTDEYPPDEDIPFDEPVADARVPQPLAPVTSTEVREVLRRVLASCHLRPSSEVVSLVGQIKASPYLLDTLTPATRRDYVGVMEALLFEAANLTPTAELDFGDVAAIENHTASANDELRAIHEVAQRPAHGTSPSARLAALVDRIQAYRSRQSIEKVVKVIDEAAPAEEKLAAFSAIVPPATQVAVVREMGMRTVSDLVGEVAPPPTDRFSSGYRTLDLAYSSPNEPLGFISLGDMTVVAGATGTGKSSFSYSTLTAMAQDDVNWGFPDAPVLLAHTEEEVLVKAKAMRLLPGQRFHHLSNKVVISNIGSSRRLLAENVYMMVVSAIMRSQQESRPISDFLPRIGFLDYLQALSEPGESSNESNDNATELVLRGLLAFNPDEIAKFSGVDFRTFTGMAWPTGIEGHRMAWVVFVQLKKSSDEMAEFYKSGKRMSLSDFTMEDTSDNPAWVDPSGGQWAWEVRENDYRLFRQGQIFGSSKILNNASNILLLHRSRPRLNPAIMGPDGRTHLTDLRARLIPDKARSGIQMLYAPMAFDVQPPDPGDDAGFRAQYYDLIAEAAIEAGEFTPHESYRASGDPILPIRPQPSPFAGVKY